MSAEITQWIDPNGAVTLLDVDWEASGRFMPPVVISEDEVPGQDGARLRQTRFGPHDFTIKMVITEASEALLRTAIRARVSAMNPKRGEGILRVTSPLGDVREIQCSVIDGMGLEEKPEMSGPQMQMALVTFHATDPLWRDQSDTSASYNVGDAPSFFPIFPIRLTSSQIVVDEIILNDGDDEMWPVWTLLGPGSGIALRNVTTGKSLVLSTTLLAGESIVIDTQPNYKTVKLQDGTNLWPDVDVTSSLWPLVEGSNAIRLEMSGATIGASVLQVNYRRKWLSP